MSRPSVKQRKNPFQHQRAHLVVETLEDRLVPSGSTISGNVYYDANANGLLDAGEAPIANNQIQLFNANNQLAGTTTTDAQGHYQFITDQTNLSVDGSVTKTVTFPSTQTNFNLNGVLAQFDPSLGQLQSVEITHAGSITSQIKVENLSTTSTSNITGNVSGTLNLVAPGVNDTVNISGSAGSFNAGMFDGTNDFGGASGTSFGQKTVNGSNTITVTDPTALQAYIGTGTLNVAETANATSNASGGGNLEVNVASTAQATITVTYHYKSAGPIQPGTYKLVQPNNPPGYSDGLESRNSVVIPNTIGTDFINVTIPTGGGDSANNNFGELKLTSLSGHVFYDANNDGVFDPGESGIQGARLTLTGGAAPVTATTDANGLYHFDNLVPGTYKVAETQPTGYLNGTDTAGTSGGAVNNVAGNENINSIVLSSGDSSQNNDFGELKPASLAGNVYVDAKNDGQLDPGDPPIASDTITLTGFDDEGPVSKTTTTANDGSYAFNNLRPGTYALTQTPVDGYTDGATTVGSQGGTGDTDTISAIDLGAGVAGVNNNFGELKPDVPGDPLPKDVGPFGMLPYVSKIQATTVPNPEQYLDPTVHSQLAFIVGTSMTLTQHQPNTFEALAALDQFKSGMTQASYVDQLWSSDAHRALQASAVYQDVLGRAPTGAEQSSAIQALNSGTSTQALQEQLYVSPEFQQMHPTSAGLATALYTSILNVTPGTQATQNLLQSMDNQTLNEVVHGLLTSDAALSNQIDDTFHQILRRAATASEISTWTTPLKNGTISLDDLAKRLLNSQEFFNLAFANVH